jgi:hypothetical protein
LEKEKAVPDLARRDIKDSTFVGQAILIALEQLVPTYTPPSNFWFRLIDTGSGYAVDTNLEYRTINSIYHQSIPPEHSSIDSAYLLSHILDARADTFFSAYYMAELVTTPVCSQIIRLKHFDFLRRREINVKDIEQFKELVIPDFPSLREIINSGERSFSELFELLDQAEQFKHWLKAANPDIGLIQSYHRAATQSTWADRLPSKSIRFLLSAGLGLAADAIAPTGLGTAMGLGIGATDSLLIDRIIRGWRPSHFIEGPYRNFVANGG